MQQVLLNTSRSAGADSAQAVYQSLRQRYYGSGSYDFGEVPLADVAGAIHTAGNIKDALRFHALNTQMNPTSTFALRQLAQTHLAAGDTTSAIASYERALSVNANDAQSLRALDALKRRNKKKPTSTL